MPFASAKAELDSGDPIRIKLSWNAGGGHAVVAAGYNLAAGTITIVDPWYGCGTKAFDYSSMITRCKFESGTGKWTNTITV